MAEDKHISRKQVRRMMRPKRIVKKLCSRCGKPVVTLNRPIHASQTTYDKWNSICDTCMTPEEKQQVQQDINNDFTERMRNRG